MFKYLSEILSKFTPQQRLIALLLLTTTLVLLGLGDSLIQAYSNSDRVLQDKVRRLEISQSILLKENDSLYTTISNSQIQCSRDIMDVRRSILEDLGVLEKTMMKPKHHVQRMESYEPDFFVDENGDTSWVSAMRRVEPVVVEDNTMDVLNTIRGMKAKIKKQLK